jgi:hypothetical protein
MNRQRKVGNAKHRVKNLRLKPDLDRVDRRQSELFVCESVFRHEVEPSLVDRKRVAGDWALFDTVFPRFELSVESDLEDLVEFRRFTDVVGSDISSWTLGLADLGVW